MVTVYVLLGETGRRCVGITNNLERRLSEHRSSDTSAHRLLGNFEVLCTEVFPNHAQARIREKFLKSGQGRKWLDEHFPRTGPAEGG
jgi:putative endonuclease